jgi:GNAT superfamily N-acetyltransferase
MLTSEVNEMNLEITALSPNLLDDYLNYFDNVAFTDHKEWSNCYCIHFHWNDLLETELKACENSGSKFSNRELATKFIIAGTIKGYLASLDGSVVGWCNANDKSSYDWLAQEKRPELWGDEPPLEKVKSIVCFTIAPGMRGKGIATELLNRVCFDAKAQGYTCLEAYPHLGESSTFVNHHGPYSLYEKAGFHLYKDINGSVIDGPVIVRKYL